jgi:hypothetical protein
MGDRLIGPATLGPRRADLLKSGNVIVNVGLKLVNLVLVLFVGVSALADVASRDSDDLTLNTTGTVPAFGGVGSADSADFILNATGVGPGIGGIAGADSDDFTLNTTGVAPSLGGIASADSPDFALNTMAALIVTGPAASGPASLPNGRLAILQPPDSASIAITLDGSTNSVYCILASTNLLAPGPNWVELLRLTNTAGRTTFTNPISPEIPQRFFRAIEL